MSTTVLGVLPTGGEYVEVRCALPWVTRRIHEACDGNLVRDGATDVTMRVCVEHTRTPFDTSGWTRLSRDAWCLDGSVVVRDVATSGFDMRLGWDGPLPDVVLRWRPPRSSRAASAVLRSRARLLLRSVVLSYPVLWAACARGRAPLHAPAVSAGGTVALLVGPSGVGKSTLVAAECSAGGAATGDNLSIGDGRTVWGVTEPIRTEGGGGRRAPHGRREAHLPSRVEALEPHAVILLRRGDRRAVSECDPELAVRELVAGTYAAGELRRYWPLHSLLALGTGRGPAHPAITDVATHLASHVQFFTLELPAVQGVRLGDVLSQEGVAAWS